MTAGPTGVVTAKSMGVTVTVSDHGVTVSRAWWAAGRGGQTVTYPYHGLIGVVRRGLGGLVLRTPDHDEQITFSPAQRQAFAAVHDAILAKIAERR